MPSDLTNLTAEELKEKVLKGVTDFNEYKKTREAEDLKRDEGIISLKADVTDAITKIQELNTAKKELEKRAEEAEKRSEELEKTLAVRTGAVQGGEGEQLKISNPDYMKAFFDYARSNNKHFEIDKAVKQTEIAKWVAYKFPYASDEIRADIVKDVSVAYGPSMGNMFPVDLQMISEQRKWEMSPLRPYATTITASTDTLTFPIDDTLMETDSRGELSPAPGYKEVPEDFEVKIELHEIWTRPRMTQKMLRMRGFDVEGWIMRRKVPQGLAYKENRNFIIGDGVQEARGFLTYNEVNMNVGVDATEEYQRGALGTYTTSGGSFDNTDLRRLFNSLITPWRPNAIWYMDRLTFSHCMGLEDEQNRPLINPQLMFLGTELQLYGKPVILSEAMPGPNIAEAFTAGTKVIAYGDFSSYIIADGIAGMNYTIRDDITFPGRVSWFVLENVGGGLIGFQSIKILKIGT